MAMLIGRVCGSVPKPVSFQHPTAPPCRPAGSRRARILAAAADGEGPVSSVHSQLLPQVPTKPSAGSFKIGEVDVPLKPTKSLFETTDEGDDSLQGNDCKVFIDRGGDFLPVMCCDYGFRSGAGRMYETTDGRIPMNGFQLGMANFGKELEGLRRSFRYDEYSGIAERNPATNPLSAAGYEVGRVLVAGLSKFDEFLENSKVLGVLTPKITELLDPETGAISSECAEIQSQLKELKLSNKAVWDRELKREAEGGLVKTPWFVRGIYLALCTFLDVFYEGRAIQRFWFLETVARMPYFSYITILHLYETLGWWRAGAELRKVHFAEEWNEMHHLQIMETLGGDQLWIDRFMGQHSAIFYYIVLCITYVVSPNLAYNFSELIEAHAVDTYGEFVDANQDLLRGLPPPFSAASYYCSEDLYMFDEFQTNATNSEKPRRPKCYTLYDVFSNIRDDEGEHVRTMKACQDLTVMEELVKRREKGRSL